MVVIRNSGRGDGGLVFNGDRASVVNDEKVRDGW